MSRYTPRQSAEFEARQMCFEFGQRARRIAREVAETIKKAEKWLSKHFRTTKNTDSPPKQLFLDLNFSESPLCTLNSDLAL